MIAKGSPTLQMTIGFTPSINLNVKDKTKTKTKTNKTTLPEKNN